MRALWRSLLLCCLALALPLHGLAATRMAMCHLGQAGGTQAGSAAALALSASTPQSGHHHHGHDATASAHDGATPAVAQAMVESPEQGQAASADTSKTAHQCSACASCGASAALLHTAGLTTPDAPAVTPVVSANAAAFHFAASGPDRPPRPDLA